MARTQLIWADLSLTISCIISRTFPCPTYSWRIPGSSGPIPGFLVDSWYIPGSIPGFLVHSWYLSTRIPGAFLVHSWYILGAFLVYSWCIPGVFLVPSTRIP